MTVGDERPDGPRFDGQSVVVTGGTRGLGRAMALAYLRAGAAVHAVYRSNEEAARALTDAAGEAAARLTLHRADVADYAAVEALWSTLEEAAPDGVQVLVNNAGVRRDALLAAMPPEDWSQVIEANLTGGFYMAKFAVQNMMRRRYGRILFVTSPAGHFGFAGQANYSASKAGQVGMMRSLCKEVAKRKITVNCVSPGFIDTELIEDLPEDLRAKYKQSVPLARFGTPEEVASAALFLTSRAASYVTGTTLEVAGGL